MCNKKFICSGSNCHQLDHHIPCGVTSMPMPLHQQTSPSMYSTSSSIAPPTTSMIRPNILYTPRAEFEHQLGNNPLPPQHLLQPFYHDQSVLCYPDMSCGSNSTLRNNTNEKIQQHQNKNNTLVYPKASSDTMTENMLFG